MGVHLIIGKGNLGLDLQKKLSESGHESRILTRSEGWSWPESFESMQALNPECIWYCVGAGSVEVAIRDFNAVVSAHALIPIDMMRRFSKETKFVLFSSDYAASEDDPTNPQKRTHRPRSLYALSKIWMEEGFEFLNKPNACVVRVGSLYGKHISSRTLPGRLHEKFPEPCSLMLPTNTVVPTLTAWVADVLVKNYERLFFGPHRKTYHLAPQGGVSVLNWGKRILGSEYHIDPKGIDETRPERSNLGCSFGEAPHWEELWNSGWWV